MLLILCHLLGEQSARAIKMSTLRLLNSLHEQREVYWVNGNVMLLKIYSKMRGTTARKRLVPVEFLGSVRSSLVLCSLFRFLIFLSSKTTNAQGIFMLGRLH